MTTFQTLLSVFQLPKSFSFQMYDVIFIIIYYLPSVILCTAVIHSVFNTNVVFPSRMLHQVGDRGSEGTVRATQVTGSYSFVRISYCEMFPR